MTENATPHALGYRMPAEWEPHTATWIAWPHNATDWPGRFQPIPWVYAEIVRQLAQWSRSTSWSRTQTQKACAGRAEACRGESGQRALSPVANEPRVDARLGPDFVGKRAATKTASWPSPTGSSTRGPNIPTGSWTTRCLTGWRSCCNLPAFMPSVTLADGTCTSWCSKAAASTPTARACC